MASTTSSLPTLLTPPLSDRDAVADALYRFVTSLDTDDRSLHDSAFTPAATLIVNGRESTGLEEIHSACFDIVSKLDTTHFITNTRIDIEGEKAKLTATVLSQHFRPGKGMEAGQTRLMAGSQYWADLVREGELWKIERVVLKSTWAEGDWEVFSSSEG